MKRAFCLGAVLALLAPRASVQAFSEPTLYTEQPVNGGGGGRFFTGSSLDAYSCAVCHRGGAAPVVEISGFPDRYEPGESYAIVVRWTKPSAMHSLNLEIIDRDGRGAGRLALPAAEDLADDDRCVLAEDEALRSVQASYLMPYGGRTVVGVRNCGARSLHFTFTAPDDDKIALTAAVVRADASQDPNGDGVLELRQIARRVGAPEDGPMVGSCAVGPQADGLSALLLAVMVVWRRARRRAPPTA